MNKKGFTLIELLVVISIIALLMSVLMPSLQKARQQARMTICMSNMRQVSLGALTYEAEMNRLPAHLWELSMNAFGESSALPKQITMGLVNPNYDVRPYYKNYINVNYFKCPMVAKWKRDVSDIDNTYNIYTDYFISGGYWGSLDPTQTWKSIVGRNYSSSKLYTKSTRNWTYGGYRFNVLFGDCTWKYISGNQLRTNHPGKGTSSQFLLDPPNTSRWVETFYYGIFANNSTVQDYLRSIKTNYAFSDGSAKTFSGDDEKIVEVLHRRDANYSFFLPHR